jgi:hypothetical protein
MILGFVSRADAWLSGVDSLLTAHTHWCYEGPWDITACVCYVIIHGDGDGGLFKLLARRAWPQKRFAVTYLHSRQRCLRLRLAPRDYFPSQFHSDNDLVLATHSATFYTSRTLDKTKRYVRALHAFSVSHGGLPVLLLSRSAAHQSS